MKVPGRILSVYGVVMVVVLLAAALGSRAVTTLSENKPVFRSRCIVIDPGHGGEDGGAVSRSGLPESGYNLEISLRLRDLFHLLGYQTRMIRTTDVSVYTKGESLSQKKASDLKQRVSTIRETEGALLLSIHQNHFPQEQYSGAQVFYAGTDGSEALAKQLQEAFRQSLNPGSRRQPKKSSGVYLMEHITCPGVLIECGFLSNPEEETRLRDPEYQKKLCGIIAVTTGRYLSNT